MQTEFTKLDEHPAIANTDGKFDSIWRSECEIKKVSISEVRHFVQKHYLGKPPAIVMLCLMMLHKLRPVGCIIYAAPPQQTEKRYGGKTWELARLYLLDAIPCNAETWLIGKSVKWIKRFEPTVKHLVSYADPSAGHAGTIYKAANWKQDGRTDDERKTPRFDYVNKLTGQKYGRRNHIPDGVEIVRQARVSKYRFFLDI